MEPIDTLNLWATIQTNHVRLFLAQAPGELREDRQTSAASFANFIEAAVFTMVAGRDTKLAEALQALRKELAKQPDQPTKCATCRAAILVETLAGSLAAHFAAVRKGGVA